MVEGVSGGSRGGKRINELEKKKRKNILGMYDRYVI